MKNKFLNGLTILNFILLLNACYGPNGPDGLDGTAYIAVYDYDGNTYSYEDNNPSTPNYLTFKHSYPTDAGYYTFVYESRIHFPTYYLYSIWIGYYEIWINKGEKGGEGKIFWQSGDQGKHGEDSYLKLYLDFDGPFLDRINKELFLKKSDENNVMYYDGKYFIKLSYTQKSTGKIEINRVTNSE